MSILQRHWDARAAANFILGGAGSGLVLCSALLEEPAALALGLAMIAAGLGMVWLEIGRKLRAIHVFFNPFTSWMTRESFAAVAVFALGVGVFVFQDNTLHYLAALAAAAFLYCQGRILRAAKGIAAWRAAEIVPLIVTTGLSEGAALALLFAPTGVMALTLAAAVGARALAWRSYRIQVKSVALEGAGILLVRGGTVAALAFSLIAWKLPEAAPLAALAALAPGWWLKFVLVTRAAFKQDYTLLHLPVRGTR
jgi:phenylacetyl-CoA:acceptor oxidoreductase 26-kDa subunit